MDTLIPTDLDRIKWLADNPNCWLPYYPFKGYAHRQMRVNIFGMMQQAGLYKPTDSPYRCRLVTLSKQACQVILDRHRQSLRHGTL